MNQTRHAGVWTIEDRCESVLHYLPFDVPYGAPISLDRAEAAIAAAVRDTSATANAVARTSTRSPMAFLPAPCPRGPMPGGLLVREA